MYRLMLYFLSGHSALAIVLAAVGLLSFSPVDLLRQLIVIILFCWLANYVLARVSKVQSNPESWLITALIIFLIIGPLKFEQQYWPAITASLVAMTSKYLLVWRRRHLFNPAAAGVLAAAFITGAGASWWVGQPLLNLPLVFGGLIMARKAHRLVAALAFIACFLLLTTLWRIGSLEINTLGGMLWRDLAASPLLFLALVMVIEPLTSPARRVNQLIYGGVIAAAVVGLGNTFSYYFYTFETALLIGNIIARVLEKDGQIWLTFVKKEPLNATIFQFSFKPDRTVSYSAGQFGEFQLPHPNPDNRGIRRWFTFVSSPSEAEIKIATRFIGDRSSSFKKALMSLKPGSRVSVNRPEGEFVLPSDRKRRLLFVAGGIGVTPFRSIVRYLIDNNLSRDVVLLFLAKDESDFVYKGEFEAAAKNGLKLILWPEVTRGRISAASIEKMVPDYRERLIYISGPEQMVEALETLFIEDLGSSKNQLKQDYFPGYDDTLLIDRKAA